MVHSAWMFHTNKPAVEQQESTGEAGTITQNCIYVNKQAMNLHSLIALSGPPC